MSNKRISIMKYHYNKAKDAKVGDNIVCPGCNGRHIKTTYQKVFCSNIKTKPTGNCKDKFWNIVDPEKRCRNTPYFRDVILPNRESEEYFDDDPSWDAHKDTF